MTGKNTTGDFPGWSPLWRVCIMPDHDCQGRSKSTDAFHKLFRSTYGSTAFMTCMAFIGCIWHVHRLTLAEQNLYFTHFTDILGWNWHSWHMDLLMKSSHTTCSSSLIRPTLEKACLLLRVWWHTWFCFLLYWLITCSLWSLSSSSKICAANLVVSSISSMKVMAS